MFIMGTMAVGSEGVLVLACHTHAKARTCSDVNSNHHLFPNVVLTTKGLESSTFWSEGRWPHPLGHMVTLQLSEDAGLALACEITLWFRGEQRSC